MKNNIQLHFEPTVINSAGLMGVQNQQYSEEVTRAYLIIEPVISWPVGLQRRAWERDVIDLIDVVESA